MHIYVGYPWCGPFYGVFEPAAHKHDWKEASEFKRRAAQGGFGGCKKINMSSCSHRSIEYNWRCLGRPQIELAIGVVAASGAAWSSPTRGRDREKMPGKKGNARSMQDAWLLVSHVTLHRWKHRELRLLVLAWSYQWKYTCEKARLKQELLCVWIWCRSPGRRHHFEYGGGGLLEDPVDFIFFQCDSVATLW